MRAGRLRHLVTLQSPTGTQNSVGERDTLWGDVENIWAGIEPLKAAEIIAAAQSHMDVTHRVIIRHDSSIAAITHGWRVVFGQRVFDINGIRNINEMDKSYELMCSEGLLYNESVGPGSEPGVFSTDYSSDFA